MITEILALKEERILSAQGRCELYANGRRRNENAVSAGESLSLEAHLPRQLGCEGLSVVFANDEGELWRQEMQYLDLADGMDVYGAELTIPEAGLLFYSFVGKSATGDFYGMRAPWAREISFSRTPAGAHFQLTVTRFSSPAPTWLYGGILYHIFVDRFCRVGTPPVREDAILNADWEKGIPELPAYRGAHLENNEFFGGTLDGIHEKLPYLSALGVNCLYLTPIFEAYSNHKYDTGDYERVDAMFGGEEALLRLLAAAREQGMRIVLDGVFNHTGADSVYFNKKGRYRSLGAYESRESPYFDWYNFRNYPNDYEAWWGIHTLPRLSHSSPSLRDFLVGEDGVVARYASLGIGGFRLDVVDELSDDLVRAIKGRLAANAPDAVLFGEVWEDASCKVAYGRRKRYYCGDELDGVMNYPLRTGLIAYLREGDVVPLRYALLEVMANMPHRIANTTMNLLGSHDTIRILTALAGEAEGERSPHELAHATLSPSDHRRGIQLLILAYLALSTLPGIPTIFYGDEVGMEGYSDPLNRLPFPWHRCGGHLLRAYRAIGRMRRKERVYREGEFRLVHLDADLLAFTRSVGRRVALTLLNRSERRLSVRFDGAVRCLFGERARGERFFLLPRSGAVFLTDRGRHLSLCFDDGACVYF